MLKKFLLSIAIIIAAIVLYFVAWPVPIEPVPWKAPPDPGYTGKFTQNKRLKDVEILKIGDNHGPEDVAVDKQGRIYGATHDGNIVRLQPDGFNPENWANTGGRPLGIDFDPDGNLIVADAFRGLLSIAPDSTIKVLATEADGIPIVYADDVDCAADGKIYFSDASTKFSAKAIGDTMEASVYEGVEHTGTGRLLVYNPATDKAITLMRGLFFANGVAVSHDQTYVLVNDTWYYRIVRYWISGPKKGKSEFLIENLPAFPDNISQGLDGRFWVALISPRNPLIDSLAGYPFMRKVIFRMPKFLQPAAQPYGHIIVIDGNGNILEDLQDPDGGYPLNTSVIETKDYLYIGSLVAPGIGRLNKAKAGL
jgi:sugar lactone lactonase YvrE